jgi:hypothetical protein
VGVTEERGRIQIYSVEERDASAATCVVRCVGGVVRSGRWFADGDGSSPVLLDWIDRYQRRVDFIDPVHSAKVHLSGEAVAALAKGVVLAEVDLSR